MHIGIVAYSYLPNLGGAQVQAHGIANSLVKAGNQVTVLSSNKNVRQCAALGWSFSYRLVGIRCPSEKLLLFSNTRWKKILEEKLVSLTTKYRFDVVQIVMLWPWVIAASRLRQEGIPVFVRAAGEDIQIDSKLGYGVRRSKQKDQLIRDSLQHVDTAVAISETVKHEYIEAGMSERAVVIIPPGLDYQRFQSCPVDVSRARRDLGIEDDKKIILGVGRNHPKKRFCQLLYTLKLLNKDGNKFVLIIVGDKSNQLKTLAKELAEMGNFRAIEETYTHPAGHIETLPTPSLIALYKIADYFVSTSSLETYVNTAIEAMACKTPVIVTDAPGARDTVRHNVDGIVVSLDEPNMIAAAISELEVQPEVKERMMSEGERKAATMSWNLVAKKYYDLYEYSLSTKS